MAKKTDRPGVNANVDGSFSVLVLGGPFHLLWHDGKKVHGVKNEVRVYADDPKSFGDPFAIPETIILPTRGRDGSVAEHVYELTLTKPKGARVARMCYVHNLGACRE